MSALANSIKTLRESKGWSQQELAGRMGMARTSLTERELGNIGIKPPERRRFADAFGLSLEEFDLHWRPSKINQTKGGNGIPVINRAPAGDIVDYEEYGTDSGQGYEYLDFGGLPEDEMLFAVIVVGDSMMPTIKDGDKLIFKPLDRERPSKFEDAQVCFIRFAEEYDHRGCTIARVSQIKPDQLLLAKDNREHRQRVVDREMIIQLAVAVELRTASI